MMITGLIDRFWIGCRGMVDGASRDQARSGVAGVEFAIVLPFLVAGSLMMIDYGTGVYLRTQLDAATRTGAQFAMDDKGNTTAIATAVKAAADLPANSITVTTTQFCECTYGSTVSCASTCSGDNPMYFLRVQAAYTVGTMLVSPYTVTGETVIRTE